MAETTGHDYGLVIKKSDDFYIVDVNPNVYNSGYGVVSKEEDPYGKYDLADVQAWALAHPDNLLTEHPLESEMALRRQLESEEAELEAINRQLFDAMVDTVFGNAGIATMADGHDSSASSSGDSSAADVPSLMAAREEAKETITSLRSQIDSIVAARQSA